MLDDLLALSRLELDQKPELEPVMLGRIMGQVVSAFAPLQARPETMLTMPEVTPLVLAEPGYIDHVVRNLLSNADKYSPPGTPIEVEVLLKPCELEIHVLDRGPGVPPEEAERIFDRFFRSDRTSGLVGGAGIGLAVCKRLVGLMGGRIWAGPREGGGLDIAFSLPTIGDEVD
jgi:signal transduction histidine kinase